MKKNFIKIISILIAIATLFGFAACGKTEKEKLEGTTTSTRASESPVYEAKGEGKNTFFFDVVFQDGKSSYYKIKTNKAFVGEALKELGLVEGEEGPYGLFIKTVDGETHKYEDDGKYWAFYVDGTYAEKSADQTEIQDSHYYSFKVEA